MSNTDVNPIFILKQNATSVQRQPDVILTSCAFYLLDTVLEVSYLSFLLNHAWSQAIYLFWVGGGINGSFYGNVHFCVPSLYRNITLEKHFRVTISLYFKMKQYIISTITPSWAINVAIFVFKLIIKNSKHHKTACPHSHVQRESALLWGQKQVFLPLKIQ